MAEDGDVTAVADSNSTSFSSSSGILMTKVSISAASIKNAILLRLSWVFLSVSCRAEVAPTPNRTPAVVGGVILPKSSVMRSRSLMRNCRANGTQLLLTREIGDEKNLGSRKASESSFFQAFWLLGNRVSWYRRSSIPPVALYGNDLDLKVGLITFVEIAIEAATTLSGSTRTLRSSGTVDTKTATMSTGGAFPLLFRSPLLSPSVSFPPLSLSLSPAAARAGDSNTFWPIGLTVNAAVSSLMKRSCAKRQP